MAREESLYIPYGLTNRKEFFPGFAKKEAIKCSISAVIGVGVGLLLEGRTDNIALVVILGIVGGTIGFMLFVVDSSTNSCMWDQAKQMISFLRSQKDFPYERLEEMQVDISFSDDFSKVTNPERLILEVKKDEYILFPIRQEDWKSLGIDNTWQLISAASTIDGVKEVLPRITVANMNELNYLASFYEEVTQEQLLKIETKIKETEWTEEPLPCLINIFLDVLRPRIIKKKPKSAAAEEIKPQYQGERDIPSEYLLSPCKEGVYESN